jgi:hypothetical protein
MRLCDPSVFGSCKDGSDIVEFNNWLAQLPHRYKIVIAGNQEYIFNRMTREEIQSTLLTNCDYLQDSSITRCGLTFYGTPWQTSQNMSFSCARELLDEKWQLIPTDGSIDIVTRDLNVRTDDLPLFNGGRHRT